MALFSQAALLDELFGTDRNCTSKKEITWEDETICKYYLAGFCPHDLFVNTKMSLGQCPKVHDVKLLERYKNSTQFLRMSYERRLNQFLQRYVDDVKKKIVYNVERLENGLLSGTEVGIQKRITALEKEINELVQQIEDFGNEGRIEDCRNLNNELEEKQKTLKYDRIELETQRRNTRERLEEVCNTCGAYISKNDPRNSLENHVSGRIHCSYVKINEVMAELNETLKKDEKHSEESGTSTERHRRSDITRHGKNHDRTRDSSHDRESHRSRDRSYGRESHRSRDNGSHRSRDRDRVRDHGRSRERDLERKQKSQKRSRDRSSERTHRRIQREEIRYSRSPSQESNSLDRNDSKIVETKDKSWGEL